MQMLHSQAPVPSDYGGGEDLSHYCHHNNIMIIMREVYREGGRDCLVLFFLGGEKGRSNKGSCAKIRVHEKKSRLGHRVPCVRYHVIRVLPPPREGAVFPPFLPFRE